MQIKDFLMVLLVVGLIAWCASGATYLLNSSYNPGSNANLSVIDDMGRDLNSSQGNASALYSIVNGNQTISAGGVTGVIFSGIGNFFKSIFNIISMPFRWIISIGNLLGIPAVISSALITLLLISITIAVISSILRRTP